MAKSNVPDIKPNCTAEVKLLNAFSLSLKFKMRSLNTPLLANHKDVQQNCAMIIMGNMYLGIFIGI